MTLFAIDVFQKFYKNNFYFFASLLIHFIKTFIFSLGKMSLVTCITSVTLNHITNKPPIM
jgi:hypothetical protein